MAMRRTGRAASPTVCTGPQARTCRTFAARSRSGSDAGRLNAYLGFIAKVLNVDLAFVIDAQGLCIASSNFAQADTLVGEHFADRDYFTAASRGVPGVQYAVGRRTNIPGIFYSAPVQRDGRFLGAAVVKIDVPNIQRSVAATGPRSSSLTGNPSARTT